MTTIACPHCQQRYRATPEIAGKQVKCQKCGQSFLAPPMAVVESALAASPVLAELVDVENAPAQVASLEKRASAANSRSSSSSLRPLVIGVAAGLFIAVGCGAIAAVLLVPKLNSGDKASEATVAEAPHQPVAAPKQPATAPKIEPPAEPALDVIAESASVPEPSAQLAATPTEPQRETVVVQPVVQPLVPLVEAAKPAEPSSAPSGEATPQASSPIEKVAFDGTPLSAETLDQIKHATVFVRVTRATGLSSGSGFVIAVENNRAIVATNHHVVGKFPEPTGQSAAPTSLTLRAVATELKQADIEVVFDSGTKQERAGKAHVLAADLRHDLALLRVEGIANLPRPMDVSKPPQLLETMPIYSFGFPFGDVLSTSKGSPGITVGKGSISSLRLDDDGKLALVQIDGSINPGNSGGPIVTSRGEVAGVAVATIRNSSGIGLAIPAEQLPSMLIGQAGPGYAALITRADGKTMLRVERWLVDPYSKIKSVALHYVFAEAGKADPDSKAILEKQAGCQKLTLTLDKHVAYTEIPVAAGDQGKKLLTQVVVQNDTGPHINPVSSVILSPPHGPTIVVPPTPPRVVIQLPRHKGQRVRIRRIPGSPGGVVQPGQPGGQPPQVKEMPGDETEILGGGDDFRFEEEAPAGGLLVGLDVSVGYDPRCDWTRAVRCIYRTGEQVTYSPWHGTELNRVVRLEAKPGYAVGGIIMKFGGMADGFCLTFMRIKGDRLDPDDAYFSKWAGQSDGPTAEFMSGNGRPVVGVIGRENASQSSGLGLRFRKADADTAMLLRHQVPTPETPKACGSQSMLVGNQGCARYRDAGPSGSLLVGIEIGLNVAGDNEFLAAMRPIFREGDKPSVLGRQHGVKWDRQIRVEARPGYAVGAMRVRSGMNADGLQLVFMRIKGDDLDPSDSYDSDWIGDKRPGNPAQLTGNGSPVRGLIGAANAVHNYGIGLLFNEIDVR